MPSQHCYPNERRSKPKSQLIHFHLSTCVSFDMIRVSPANPINTNDTVTKIAFYPCPLTMGWHNYLDISKSALRFCRANKCQGLRNSRFRNSDFRPPRVITSISRPAKKAIVPVLAVLTSRGWRHPLIRARDGLV
uniref:Uncharacterized protein n=1 Tax=Panagrellus redivivus TaxID=6233 RepID=A0A7E5A1U7_PANRE